MLSEIRQKKILTSVFLGTREPEHLFGFDFMCLVISDLVPVLYLCVCWGFFALCACVRAHGRCSLVDTLSLRLYGAVMRCLDSLFSSSDNTQTYLAYKTR